MLIAAFYNVKFQRFLNMGTQTNKAPNSRSNIGSSKVWVGKKDASGSSVTHSSPSAPALSEVLQFYQAGLFEETERAAQDLTQKYPKHPFGWKILAAVYKKTGRNIDAIKANKSAVTAAPQDYEAHYNLGNTLKALGKWDEAEKSYKQAIALNYNYPSAHYNLGSTYTKLGKLEEAEICFKTAITLKPDHAAAHNYLGLTLKQLGRLDEAVISLTKSSHFGAKNPRFYAWRGTTKTLIARQPLIHQTTLMEAISNQDWDHSEKLLKKTFEEKPAYIQDHVNEFIDIFCEECWGLINHGSVKSLIQILTKLFIVGERNKNVNPLLFSFCKKFEIANVLKFADIKEAVLLQLIYGQYYLFTEEQPKAEKLAVKNLKIAARLIKSSATEDLGWLVLRRSLRLYTSKHASRIALKKFIHDLV